MNSNNLYQILGVLENASTEEIEKKFKKLAVKYHPDKNKDPDAKELFQKISKAKDILTDPEKRSRYDKYGITDEAGEMQMQEELIREKILKDKLREVLRLTITIQEAINGFTKVIETNREIINSNTGHRYRERLTIDLNVDSTIPLNKPIIFKNKGKKYDNITGDLYIVLNISQDKIFKINKSNLNLIIRQKISIVQSLCGLILNIPYKKDHPIIIKYDKVIKQGSKYLIKNIGLRISDESDQLINSDIEIYFDIQYDALKNKETVDKLKKIFNYEEDINIVNQCYNLEEINEKINDNDNDDNEIFEQIFQSNNTFQIPGFPSGFPSGFPFPFGGINGNPNIQRGNVQECHMQ